MKQTDVPNAYEGCPLAANAVPTFVNGVPLCWALPWGQPNVVPDLTYIPTIVKDHYLMFALPFLSLTLSHSFPQSFAQAITNINSFTISPCPG